jgi:hypothetical protein
MSMIMGGYDMKKVKKGKNGSGGGGGKGNHHADLHDKLDSMGVDIVEQVAELLASPTTSDRIKADLLKDLLNYRYSKQKAVQVELETGKGITFNLDLSGRDDV